MKKKNLSIRSKKIRDLNRMIASSKKFRNIAGGTMIGSALLLAYAIPGYLNGLSENGTHPVLPSIAIIGSLCLFPFACTMYNTFCQDINCASKELQNTIASQRQKRK